MKHYYEQYKEVIHYVFFGGLTTLVNIVSFFLLDTVVGLPYLSANALSIIIAILFAYTTNKRYVFESHTVTWKENLEEFIRFIGFRSLSGLFDMLSMWVLVSFIGIDSTISKLLTQFVVVVLNYFFSKLFVFK